MRQLEMLRRAAERQMPEAPPSRERRTSRLSGANKQYALCETSFLSRVAVHVLKQDIRDGKLIATWRGRYFIDKPDIDAYMLT